MPAIPRGDLPRLCVCNPPRDPLPSAVIADGGWDCPVCGRVWEIDWEPALIPAERAKFL